MSNATTKRVNVPLYLGIVHHGLVVELLDCRRGLEAIPRRWRRDLEPFLVARVGALPVAEAGYMVAVLGVQGIGRNDRGLVRGRGVPTEVATVRRLDISLVAASEIRLGLKAEAASWSKNEELCQPL